MLTKDLAIPWKSTEDTLKEREVALVADTLSTFIYHRFQRKCPLLQSVIFTTQRFSSLISQSLSITIIYSKTSHMDHILDANMNVLHLSLRTKRKDVLSRSNYFRETSHRKDSIRNAVRQ